MLQDIPYCTENLCVNGYCYKRDGSTPMCICKPDYTGARCDTELQTERNPCACNPCPGFKRCILDTSENSGYRCEDGSNPCDSSECTADETCIPESRTTYRCESGIPSLSDGTPGI